MKRNELMEDMIELPEYSTTRYRKSRIVAKLFLLVLLLAGICTGSLFVADGIRGVMAYIDIKILDGKYWLGEKLDLKYNTQIITIEQADLDKLVEVYAKKWGFTSSTIGLAMIDKESGFRPGRHRFEESWKKYYAGKPGYERESWMNDDEYDDYFRSFGMTQVGYGIWRKFCELTSPDELYNPAIALNCSFKIMNKCLKDMAGIKDQGTRIKTCFRNYNGSGPRAEQYANDMMARIAGQLINEKKVLQDDENREVISPVTGEIIQEEKFPIEEIKVKAINKKIPVANSIQTNCNDGGKMRPCVVKQDGLGKMIIQYLSDGTVAKTKGRV